MTAEASQDPTGGRYDVAILGAGIDGLVAAAMLARAGRRVVVLEAADRVGGVLATDELAPGVRAPAVYSSVETLAPEVVADLDLEAHGLELSPPGGVFVATGDTRSRYLAPAGGSSVDTRHLRAWAAAGVGDRDVEAYEAFDGFLRRLTDALAPLLTAPLPPLEAKGARGVVALLRPLLRMRRLGGNELAEAMRFLPMPLQDVVHEHFEDEALRIAVAATGLTGSWLGPRSPGGALNLALHRCGIGRGPVAHPLFALGGPGALADALLSAAQAAGAEVLVGVEIAAIGVESAPSSFGPGSFGPGSFGPGSASSRCQRTTGLELADGRRIDACCVLSTRDPKTTFLDLVGARHLAPSFLDTLDGVRGRGTVGVVTFVLDAPPDFAHAPEGVDILSGRVLVAGSLDDLERAFDDTKYGRLPRRPFLDVTVPSAVDPSLAPAGGHVVHAWVQYPPFRLRGGDWEDAREGLGDRVQATLAAVSPGLVGRIRQRRVLTPADLASRFGLREGCIYQAEPALDQSLLMRPMPRWYRHQTPIAGLYLGGPACHGAYGISGLCGRNAAAVIIADMRGR